MGSIKGAKGASAAGANTGFIRPNFTLEEHRALAFEPLWALGMMSGTSLDGIDAALIRTDGERVDECGPALTVPYGEALRRRIRGVLGGEAAPGTIDAVADELTAAHGQAVRSLLDKAGFTSTDIGIIGFHGHTILHQPAERRTWQIGDGKRLAALTGCEVIDDFRGADVAAGGEGAPLAPLYHAALSGGLERPLAVLNIGGVANVTWIGADGELTAFDTGPGNALLDDWTLERTGRPYDADGALARKGRADEGILAKMLDHPYFAALPPKSLDRAAFDAGALSGLSAADGAATLVGFTAGAVALAAAHFPAPVGRWLVSGGGRRNSALMAALDGALDGRVEAVEALGWDGDALEAQAFGFLAVRSLRGLPLSLPGTTGVGQPTGGGRLHRP
jgi:anhydro-N-acetylmuramic acid kinase